MSGKLIFTNEIIETIMPKLSPTGWKLFCFVWRKTEGWNKDVDEISYSQLQSGTGIKGKATIRKAIIEISEFVTVDSSPGRSNLCKFDVSNLRKGPIIEPFNDGNSSEIEPLQPINGSEVEPIEAKKVQILSEKVQILNTQSNTITKNKNNKTTAVATAFEIYENEIGMLTQISRDQIEDYCTEYSEDWFIRALRIAVTANKRNLRYIGGILKKWQAQGGPQHDGPRNNGAKNGHHSQPDETATAAAQRERLIAEIKAHGLVPDLRFSGT